MSASDWVLLAGVHSAAFAVFHLAFWRLFDWPDSLRQAGVANRAIIQIANLRLVHVFALVAVLCFGWTDDLHGTSLGRALLVGMALFWVARAIEQLVFLRINRRAVHALTVLFVVGAGLFAAPLLAG